MRRLNRVFTVALALGTLWSVAAQDSVPEAGQIGLNTAQQNLQEVRVDQFEDPGFWLSSIPVDRGLILHRRVAGGAPGKEAIEAEAEAGVEIVDDNVVGVRVDFYRRGAVNFAIEAVRPIAIPGIVKTLSVHVVGRNRRHRLSAVVEDYFGNISTIPMGTNGLLNHSGWRRMTAAIPPSIEQNSPFFNSQSGLLFRGFIVEAALEESFGTYYIYFDDLRAVTDLFAEEARDPNDMVDGW